MTRLILIRHGQTDYHLKNKYCGFSNPPLNSNGIQQAEKLAVRLKNVRVQKVYSSDLKRAYQTAKIVFKNNSIEQLKNFREINFGIFEGLSYNEIILKYKKIYGNWIDNIAKVRVSGSEVIDDLIKRVRKQLLFILSENENKTIALVTHGGPIRVILSDVLNYNTDSFWKIKQDVLALNIIDFSKDSSPDIVKRNDTLHLN